MRELTSALRGLIQHTAESDNPAAVSARTVLDRVNWDGGLNLPSPASFPVVENCLREACEASGAPGSPERVVCDALAATFQQLERKPLWGVYLEHADTLALSKKFSFTSVIGPGCLLEAADVYVGFSLQGPDILYPSHAHMAGETYWIIGGDGDWKIDLDPWFAVRPGTVCLHPPEARHAMQTNRQSLLTVWAWWSDIESDIDIVR